jgi:hypothetical protein
LGESQPLEITLAKSKLFEIAFTESQLLETALTESQLLETAFAQSRFLEIGFACISPKATFWQAQVDRWHFRIRPGRWLVLIYGQLAIRNLFLEPTVDDLEEKHVYVLLDVGKSEEDEFSAWQRILQTCQVNLCSLTEDDLQWGGMRKQFFKEFV